MLVPPRYTPYPATPTLSVEAFQESAMLTWPADAARAVGVDGGARGEAADAGITTARAAIARASRVRARRACDRRDRTVGPCIANLLDLEAAATLQVSPSRPLQRCCLLCRYACKSPRTGTR